MELARFAEDQGQIKAAMIYLNKVSECKRKATSYIPSHLMAFIKPFAIEQNI